MHSHANLYNRIFCIYDQIHIEAQLGLEDLSGSLF